MPHDTTVGQHRLPATPRGFPCCTQPLFRTCRRHLPGGTVGCLRRSLPQRRRPSPKCRRVGFRIILFEACSAFTARYGLYARGVPYGPFTPEASTDSLPPRPFRLLPAGTTLAGWGSHPLRLCTFARRTASPELPVTGQPNGKVKAGKCSAVPVVCGGPWVPWYHFVWNGAGLDATLPDSASYGGDETAAPFGPSPGPLTFARTASCGRSLCSGSSE